MRRGEVYHSLYVPDGNYIILRIDGRAFHTHVKEAEYERPYDFIFNAKMVAATRKLMMEFNGQFGYTQSDEISVLLPLDTDIYDREVEKLVSLSASIVTGAYNYDRRRLDQPDVPVGFFDSRVWISGNQTDVYKYFEWRISDAWRNCVGSWAYWTARKNGLTPHQAHAEIKSGAGPHEYLHYQDINPAKLPEWQKNGVGVFWCPYTKEGYNPKTEEKVLATRRALIEESPHKDTLGWLRNRVFDVAMLHSDVVESQVPDFAGW